MEGNCVKNSKKLLITGGAGFIGSNIAWYFAAHGYQVTIFDNFKRRGTRQNFAWIKSKLPKVKVIIGDIRNRQDLEKAVEGQDIIFHLAAQVAVTTSVVDPRVDFDINALGTFNLLEAARVEGKKPIIIFASTNKVYGDRPNTLPLVELKTRYELPKNHRYYKGIDESMSIDNSLHSIFGASKVAADIMVQEYGKYFGLKTAVFRGGCLTGPAHSSTQLHGFLAYLVACIATGRKYTVFGYKGKQVRDNIHSYDLVNAFYHFYKKPRYGEVYNIGGSRHSNVSVIEAIGKTEKIIGKKGNIDYLDKPRRGDHIWYISDVSKFRSHYPNWEFKYDINRIIKELCKYGHFK